MDDLDKKAYQYFAGRIVPKGLTKKLKDSANVPTYVLEYLLGSYCTSDDPKEIEEGIKSVKNILSTNYVRADEAEKIKSIIKEKGKHTVIDKVSVKLNENKNIYQAEFTMLGIRDVIVDEKYVEKYEKLLAGGIWCIVDLKYFFNPDLKGTSPFLIDDIQPIQIPNLDTNEIKEARSYFTKEEWIDLILRSIGMEPTHFEYRVKWHLLARLIPLVENNVNLCELGPRNTGKSHIYEDFSPNTILLSGGQTTVANLFYNMAKRQIGLVGLWDTVAFDEVANIEFKDNAGVQIMKDYMANGSFSRGKEPIHADASMVFVGNINQSVQSLLKTSNLFDPFPKDMQDTAFLDRLHMYIPGWEIPKMMPEFFTDNYGFISDYLAEFFREMRKVPCSDSFDEYFKLGKCLNQRDVIAVRKIVSGFVKLIYPDLKYSKDDIEEILVFALEYRRRVKEQLKKIGGMEFYDVQFSFIDLQSMNEKFVPVMEQGGQHLIPEGSSKVGCVYSVCNGTNSLKGLFSIESTITDGSGKFISIGNPSKKEITDSIKISQNYFKANRKSISQSILIDSKDYTLQIVDLQGIGLSDDVSLASLVSYCSIALNRPVTPQSVILGTMTNSGAVNKVDELASSLQVALDSGAKKIFIPTISLVDLNTVPVDLLSKFQLNPYTDPIDAVIKMLGID